MQTEGYPFPVDRALAELLSEELARAGLPDGSGARLRFEDPTYSAREGGFHPILVLVSAEGRVERVTDLSWEGSGAAVRLGPELDFDLVGGRFRQFGVEGPAKEGRGLFRLWRDNFRTYHGWSAYLTTVEHWPPSSAGAAARARGEAVTREALARSFREAGQELERDLSGLAVRLVRDVHDGGLALGVEAFGRGGPKAGPVHAEEFRGPAHAAVADVVDSVGWVGPNLVLALLADDVRELLAGAGLPVGWNVGWATAAALNPCSPDPALRFAPEEG